MPIRFHCSKCDQRLSVSARKAESLVKCPSCKQTITVPTEAEAERAAVTRRAAQRENEAVPASSRSSSGESVEAPDGLDDSSTFPEFMVFDSGESKTVTPESVKIHADKVAISRKLFYFQGGLLAVVGIIAFILGLLIGRTMLAPGKSKELVEPVTIRGRVTFLNRGGDVLPDDNCVVIAVPHDQPPTEDIPVVGIRPADAPPAGNQVGVATIRANQGAYGRTNNEGDYEVTVPKGGRYFILIISRNATTNSPPPKSDIAQMGRYFASVSDLLQKQAYQWNDEFLRRDKKMNVRFESD